MGAWTSCYSRHTCSSTRECHGSLSSSSETSRPSSCSDYALMWNSYVVDLRRPLSELSYSAVESTSRCAPPRPPEYLSPALCQESHTHTIKILYAIEKLTELLTLPTRVIVHTPFIICMLATTTIAHLSACKHPLKDRTLKIARERIRVNLGALKTLGDIWPLGRRTYHEVGIVARELLCPRIPETRRVTMNILGDTSKASVTTNDFPGEMDFFEFPDICLEGFEGIIDGFGSGEPLVYV